MKTAGGHVFEYWTKASRMQLFTVTGHLSCLAPAGNTAGDFGTNYVNRFFWNTLSFLCLLFIVVVSYLWGPKFSSDGEEDVRSCWMTLRTGEDTLIWRRRLWIALCGGIVLEEALDRTMWRNRFGGGFGPVVGQTAYWIIIMLTYVFGR